MLSYDPYTGYDSQADNYNAGIAAAQRAALAKLNGDTNV